jgi:hypothetical protein
MLKCVSKWGFMNTCYISIWDGLSENRMRVCKFEKVIKKSMIKPCYECCK